MNYDYTFHELHLNDEVLSYGPSLYTFNAIHFPYERVSSGKMLYHYYNLCELIFKKVKSYLREPKIGLFYKESYVSIAVKFCDEIPPSESKNYFCILQQAFEKLYEDDFINNFFKAFIGREMKKEEAFVYEIPKCFSKWASDRVFRTDYGGFVCYL